MIKFIVEWYCLSLTVYFVRMIKLICHLNMPPYNPNTKKRVGKHTHARVDSIMCGVVAYCEGSVYTLGDVEALDGFKISTNTCKWFISDCDCIGYGDAFVTDGYFLRSTDKPLLVDIYYIAKNDRTIVSKFLDKQLSKYSWICLGVMCCVKLLQLLVLNTLLILNFLPDTVVTLIQRF